MRRLLSVAILAAGLASCSEGEKSPAPPADPAPTAAELQARLAALPTPYNAADLASGQAKFGLCRSCHTIVPGGANMTGPNLHGVFGRRAAAVEGYRYSEALRTAGIVWVGSPLSRANISREDNLDGHAAPVHAPLVDMSISSTS